MENIFNSNTCEQLIQRINQLTETTIPQWGTMNAAQMLAHCNVTYEMAFENIHPKAGALKRFLLNLFVKSQVVGDKPYRKNSPTAPIFKVSSNKDFAKEKERLIQYLRKCVALGENYFEGKESLSFGALSSNEWNTMFYKHLYYHLTQFGV